MLPNEIPLLMRKNKPIVMSYTKYHTISIVQQTELSLGKIGTFFAPKDQEKNLDHRHSMVIRALRVALGLS